MNQLTEDMFPICESFPIFVFDSVVDAYNSPPPPCTYFYQFLQCLQNERSQTDLSLAVASASGLGIKTIRIAFQTWDTDLVVKKKLRPDPKFKITYTK